MLSCYQLKRCHCLYCEYNFSFLCLISKKEGLFREICVRSSCYQCCGWHLLQTSKTMLFCIYVFQACLQKFLDSRNISKYCTSRFYNFRSSISIQIMFCCGILLIILGTDTTQPKPITVTLNPLDSSYYQSLIEIRR